MPNSIITSNNKNGTEICSILQNPISPIEKLQLPFKGTSHSQELHYRFLLVQN